MTLVRFLLRESRGTVALAIAAGALGGVCGVGLIALTHAELARAAPSGSRVALAFAGLCLLSALLRVAAQVALARLGQGSVTKLCLHLCRRILALPLEAFEATDRGALVAVLTEDVVTVANALAGLPLLCINIPVALACFAYVGAVSPLILVCGLAFAALGLGAYLALASRAVLRLRAARGTQDRLVGHFRTVLEGFRELKQHRRRREALLDEGVGPAAHAARDETAAGLTLFAIAEGWSGLAFFGFLGFVLFILPALRPVPRADLSAAALVVLFLMAPLDVIVTWLPALGRAKASVLKIEALLPTLTIAAGDDPPPAAGPARAPESVGLSSVTYAYRPEPDGGGFALGPLDLTLRAGEVVFLAGGNGSGKTTLVKLLAGLYNPASGTALVDGEPIPPGRAAAEAYRQLFTVVFADGHLFQDLYGLGTARTTDVTAGLERLGLAGHVRLEGNAFSTTDLSQGQRRRLALLNALLEDRPVLVFDEWAANQDATFKRFFYRELLPELRAEGKALLVISHDEDYYDAADRLVRLRAGRVVTAEVPLAVMRDGC